MNDPVKTHGKSIFKKTWRGEYWHWNGVLASATFRLLWFIIMFRAGDGFVAAASSFYSAASAIRREAKERAMTFVEKAKFRFAASVAVALAFLALVAKFFTVTNADQADVLGTIFAKAGMRWFALARWEEISMLHDMGRAQDHTYAFAMKWARDLHPDSEQSEFTAGIRDFLKKHPEWPPTVKARLYEALGEHDLERIEREKIARDVA